MFGFNFIGKSIQAGIGTVKNINNTAITIVGVGDKLDQTQKMVTNYYGAVTGGVGLGKGVVDTAEALVCNDGLCAAVSGVGCLADGLQILASFLPGPNITMIITSPISLGCKTFVWCCKRSKLPWGSC